MYTKAEIQQIVTLRDKQNAPFAKIATLLGREEKDIKVKYRRIKAAAKKQTSVKEEKVQKEVKPAVETTAAVQEPKWTSTTTELSPRDMIKKLYSLGYRIENNQLVCYVKQVVKVKDIIAE